MKKHFGWLVVVALLSVGTMTAIVEARGNTGRPAGDPFFKGEVLRIEKDLYIVKDAIGNEVIVYVDKSTKMGGTISVGDRIEAEVTRQGHVKSIRRAVQ